MSLPLLVAISAGLAVFGIGWLIYGYHLQVSSQLRRQRQFERLSRLSDDEVQTPERELPVVPRGLYERIAALFAGVPAKDGEVRLLLARAGYRGLQAQVLFHAIRLILAVVLALVFASYALAAGSLFAWFKAVLAAAVGYVLPHYGLRFIARRRVREIARELPLFVDYLRMIHSSGVSLEQAMLLFAEERRIGLPVLADEFAAVRLSMKSGRAQSDALRQMADQIGSPDLKELIALLNEAERYGSGLQEPLKRFAVRLGEKRRFEMQEYVGKLATRMVVVMVVFLLPALIIITAGPGFIAVFKALSSLS